MQMTAYELRMSDWSADVCSSDLHFGRDRYTDFFTMAYEALPAGGVMLLHTIIKPSDEEFAERGLPLTMTKIRFMKFIMDEIFPGGDLPNAKTVKKIGRASCRERVGQYVEIRVVAVALKKK